ASPSHEENGLILPYQHVVNPAPPSPAPPSVTEDPISDTIAYGSSTFLTASAAGVPAPSVQWQVSTDNGSTFHDIPGATGTVLFLDNTPVSESGRRYHAVFTNPSGSATTAAATLTVNSVLLTISANDKSIPFHGAIPPLDATYGDPATGAVLRNGDTPGSLDGTLHCTTSASSTSAPGPYPITCDGQTSPNYTITYRPGTLTVAPAVQAIHFTTTAPTHAFVGGTYTPVATGGASGNPVTFSIDP